MNEQIKALIRAYADGVITSDQMAELEQALRGDATVRQQYLQELNLHAALEDVAVGETVPHARNNGYFYLLCHAMLGGDTPETERSISGHDSLHVGRVVNIARWSLAIAMVAVVALIATVYVRQPNIEPRIATITGLSGPLQWTGSGGRVLHDLGVGAELPGGTVEGMAPDSWFELEFNDGSAVTISGNSTLTFSDHGQKELHLKAGSFSGNVLPQPKGKPMLIHTRSAMLQVLGTQFEVEAGLSSTILNVSEGKVRAKRRSDGDTVDVLANHRLTVSPESEMSPERVPDSVDRWKSQLHRGPHGTYGEWSSSGTNEEDAGLKAIPYTTEQDKTIYTASINVSSGDSPPVVLRAESRIRVAGYMKSAKSAHRIFFGLSVRHSDGEFAGRFQVILPADEFQNGRPFVVDLDLRDYELDPSLTYMKEKLPSVPFDLIVDSLWCHTLYDQAGLVITDMELIGPDKE
jgi:hypothetical protein